MLRGLRKKCPSACGNILGSGRKLTLVGLRAGVCRCTSCSRPLVWPVTVDIPANARVAADGLTVLAPQAVRGLGVDESIRVHNGSDVEVELVHHGGDGGVRPVLGQQRVRDVLCRLGGDPLASMDVSVENNGGLGTLASAAPDVDARKCTAAHRCANGVDLRVGREAGLEVVQEGQMRCIGVVGGEPNYVLITSSGSQSDASWNVKTRQAGSRQRTMTKLTMTRQEL